MIQTRTIGSLTEIYVQGGGNYMTQTFPTNFHSFYKRKVLTSSESVNDFKEVTQAERTQIEAQDAKWERPPQSFIDLWNGTYSDIDWINYNENTGYFEVNPTMHGKKVGFTDISYDEAVQIYNRACDGKVLHTPYNTANIRINLPPYNYHNPVYSYDGEIAIYNRTMEVLLMAWAETSTCAQACKTVKHMTKLRTILGIILIPQNSTFDVIATPVLEEIGLALIGNHITIKLGESPLVSLASFRNIVESGKVGNTATITVHADVYAKLTGDTTNAAAAALSAEELAQWQQLMTDATAKNISFIEATT